MELGEYVAVLRKRWLVIVAVGLLGMTAGYLLAQQTRPTYRSSSTLYVSVTRGDTVSELVQGAAYTQNLVQSYVQLASMPAVLDPVIARLGLKTTARALAPRVTADSPLNTMLIKVSAVSPDPQAAADIANATALQLARTVADLSPKAANGSASIAMTAVADALPARAPFSPRPTLNAAAGGALGLALGVLFAFVWAQMDTRVRTAKDLPTSPARATLGQIPRAKTLHRHPLAIVDDRHSLLAESYRRLRTNLQFLDASRKLRSLVVTSTVPGEGKSTTSINLALIMAENGARVLLVDADLRSPSIARICGLEGAAGLSAVLINEAEVDDVVQPWGAPGLDVLTAGLVPPNPSQLLESEAMRALLKQVRAAYDLVIVDTAPLLAVTDGAILARETDGAVVVARSRKVKRPELAEALASLDSVGATCLGLLVNSVPTSRSDSRYGYGRQPARRQPFRLGRARLSAAPPVGARLRAAAPVLERKDPPAPAEPPFDELSSSVDLGHLEGHGQKDPATALTTSSAPSGD